MLETAVLASLVALPAIGVLIAGVAAILVDKGGPLPARILNAFALGLGLVAYGLFGAALFFPAIDSFNGVMCLVGGPLGFIGCVQPVFPWAFVWLATPTVCLALALAPVDNWAARLFALGQQLVGIGLATLLFGAVGRMEVVLDVGVDVRELGPGYYLWVASLCVFTLATQILSAAFLARRLARAEPPADRARPS